MVFRCISFLKARNTFLLKNLAKHGLFFVMLLLYPSSLPAGRFLNTENAGVADRKSFSTELSLDFLKSGANNPQYMFLFVPVYGIGEQTEISAEIPYSWKNVSKGVVHGAFGDLVIVSKNMILPERYFVPAVLLKTRVKFSNGNAGKEFGSGNEHIGFTGVFTKTFGNISIHSNIGYTFITHARHVNENDYILFGIAGELSLRDTFIIEGEIYGESDSHFDVGTFKHHILNPLLGFSYRITKSAIFDAAVRAGITKRRTVTDFGITTGISLVF